MVEVIDLTSNDKDDNDTEVVGPPSHSIYQGTESPGFSMSNFSGSDNEQDDNEPLENLMRDILAAESPLLINGVDPFADLDESQCDNIALLHKRRFPSALSDPVPAPVPATQVPVDMEARMGGENPCIHPERYISPERNKKLAGQACTTSEQNCPPWVENNCHDASHLLHKVDSMRKVVGEMRRRLKDVLEGMSANAQEVRNWREDLKGEWRRREEAWKKG